jgi:hypothetical protein
LKRNYRLALQMANNIQKGRGEQQLLLLLQNQIALCILKAVLLLQLSYEEFHL